MKYTVVWGPRADRRVIDMWISADSVGRALVTAAANEIDRQLRIDAHEVGESRPNGRRILIVSPLVVSFRASKQDRLVRVINVWRFARRKRK